MMRATNIVMVSGRRDGFRHQRSNCATIANYGDDDPQALSERIVGARRKDRADGHEDDVSAVVLLIE